VETVDWITGGIALAALLLGVANVVVDRRRASDTAKRESERDEFERRTTEEAVDIQRRVFEIEERRHGWEQQERAAEDAERQRLDEEGHTAEMRVRFAFRDSARTWGRILATNYGPADATDVTLDVYAEQNGQTVDVEPVSGTDYRTADVLQRNESVHIGVAFSSGSPQLEDLRYRLSWVDGRGGQTAEGRIPID
jgi:hypothetical protein